MVKSSDKYIGRKLDGRYQVTEQIGVGGMAYVYKATDLKDGSTVAVKILKDELLENQELVRRFKNESKAISMLNHENIVKVLDVNFSDTVQYLVMEYLDGITLKEYIQAHGKLTWKETVYFSEQLLRALQHAHDRGIIHRDMKPQNVMLLRDGKVKVMDFGIARFSRSNLHTITDKTIGTVHYISPEQAKGEETNAQSDIYSVGVMMYEMCTGKLPFDADSALSVALQQISNTPKKVTELDPTIPEGLEEVISKAMEKDRSLRYSSAGAMLRDIDNFKNNPSIRFEYKYLSSDAPTVYLDHTKGRNGEIEPNQRITKMAETTKETKKVKKTKEKKEKPLRPKTINFPIGLLMGLTAACMIGAIVLVMLTLNMSGSQIFSTHDDVELPNFVGKDLRTIQGTTEYGTFNFEVVQDFNSEYQSGIVYDQTPTPPKTVKDNANIVLYVSKGKEIVTIPNVVGETYGNSVKALQDLGLVVSRETDNNPEIEGNIITKVDPGVGTSVESGSNVTIYVNSPNTTTSSYVPLVVGMSVANAKATLSANGLRAGSVVTADSAEPAGTVLGQSIGQGVRVSYGTRIDLTVSTGITPQTRTFKFSLPYASKKNKTSFPVRITVGGQEFNSNGSSMGTVSFTKEGLQDEAVQVFVDGDLYCTATVNYQTGGMNITSTESGFPAKPPEYTVTVSGPGFSESKTVTAGSECKIGIGKHIPEGCKIASVSGGSVIENTVIYVTNVQGDMSISVTFTDPPAPKPEDNGGESSEGGEG